MDRKIQRAAEKERKGSIDSFATKSVNTFERSIFNPELIKYMTILLEQPRRRHIKSVRNTCGIYLEKKGEIYLSKYSGWYSVSDEAFYSDDEIEEKD